MPRAAARWPQFTKAFRVIGDSYAELRYGPGGPHRYESERARRCGDCGAHCASCRQPRFCASAVTA
jgi:hypothetical protein